MSHSEMSKKNILCCILLPSGLYNKIHFTWNGIRLNSLKKYYYMLIIIDSNTIDNVNLFIIHVSVAILIKYLKRYNFPMSWIVIGNEIKKALIEVSNKLLSGRKEKGI